GSDRIRYTTSHTVEFTPDIIDAYADVPELVDHLHLAVHSGSDRVLNLMKRGHTAIEYKSTIRKLRKLRRNISMSSVIIIGFPRETTEAYEATMKLINDIGVDLSIRYINSATHATPAADLQADV
ncbi:radical SAM protein, partial [Pseudoalteromonas ruthenica]|uniref:radical SAM protein n=1 Tax=Pseudoalteromonas ruthenica TaxID=151081 RepID=UPI00110AD8D7